LLAYALQTVLKMAHPFAPFVTEAVWQTLDVTAEPILAAALWPKIPKADKKRAMAFEEAKQIITEARAIMKAVNVQNTVLYCMNAPVIMENRELIGRLAHLTDVAEDDTVPGIKLTSTPYDVRLDISEDKAAAYAKKLSEQAIEAATAVKRLKERLGNKAYVQNAPKAVVAQTYTQLEDAEAKQTAIKQELARFKR